MFILVTGGSGSGKSEFAENIAMKLGGKMLYVATMKPYDDECLKRIERHRKMRDGKGFRTVECYTDLSEITEKCRYNTFGMYVEFDRKHDVFG